MPIRKCRIDTVNFSKKQHILELKQKVSCLILPDIHSIQDFDIIPQSRSGIREQSYFSRLNRRGILEVLKFRNEVKSL